MSDNTDSNYLDGNALAGPMSVVIAGDLTTAIATCADCGREDPVASLPVFGAPMGLVARCPGCDNVLLSYADLPTGRAVQMRGMAALRLPPA